MIPEESRHKFLSSALEEESKNDENPKYRDYFAEAAKNPQWFDRSIKNAAVGLKP